MALISARGIETMGYSVARANSVAPAVAVLTAIALTGYGNREDIERCLRAGFNRHLTKPVSFVTLRQTIAEVCAHATER